MEKNSEVLKKSVIYQMFIRNETKEGTLKAAKQKLAEVQALGVNILQLLPVHPIGKLGRKGTYGSPYSIQDYEAVSPDLGTKEDLKDFIQEAHRLGMKVILDMVFNHTSRDSVLLDRHPEWYYRDKEGNIGNKAGCWSDVADLDHEKPGLDEYLVHTVMKEYLRLGADGFRFDVASFLPSRLYRLARKSFGAEPIFVGEAVDSGFLLYARAKGIPALSNGELFASGVDCVYHYASWKPLKEFLEEKDERKLLAYRSAFEVESASRSQNGLILRAVENHDQPRIASYSSSDSFVRNVLAFSFFTMGPAFLYAGEENKETETVPLFEKKAISDHSLDPDYTAFVKTLVAWKREKNQGLRETLLLPSEGKTLLLKNRFDDGREVLGLFNLAEKPLTLTLGKEEDGRYLDLLSQDTVEIQDGTVLLDCPRFLVKKED